MTEKELRAARDYVQACLTAMNAGATERSFTPEEQAEWTEGVAYVVDADVKLARFVELRGIAQRPGQTEVTVSAPEIMHRVSAFEGDAMTATRSQVVDRARAALDIRDLTEHLDDSQKVRMERLLKSRDKNIDGSQIARRLLITESEAYRSAFQKIAGESLPVLTSEEGAAINQFRELRAASESNASGGYGVPVLIDPTIVLTSQGTPNVVFDAARKETITTNAWKGVSSAGVSWSFDAEAAEVSDDAPTLAQPSVTVYSARGFIPFSFEIAGDYPGFASEMSRLLAEGYSELLASKLTNGNGTTEPRGIVTALDANTNDEVVVTTDGAFGSVDVYAAWKSLPVRYRRNARFMSSVGVENKIRQFAAGSSNSDANYTINITQMSVEALFGRPFDENEYMPDFTGTTGAANILIVGDFSNYLVAQRAGMDVELVPHLFHTDNNRPNGQRGWFATARVGGNSINDIGFRLLQNQ